MSIPGSSSDGPPLDPEVASSWIESWDRQQELYAVARDERSDVVAEIVATSTTSRPAPVVVDLGCGPGSLTVRIARRVPHARVIGLDTDPLLLALGRAATPGIELVDVEIGSPGWTQALPQQVDAVVSSTTLHYFPAAALRQVYRDVASHLRPGGVLVNADHLTADDEVLDTLGEAVARRTRAGSEDPRSDVPDWTSWWTAAAAEPRFRPLLEERRRRAQVAGDHQLSAATHAELLLESGFSHCGTVWQDGPSTVLVAVR